MAAASLLIVLVGPKGCGKTTIGRALARTHGVCFLEVEAIAKRVLAASGNVIDEHYARRAFDAIAEEVDALAERHAAIAIETTGASEHTAGFLAGLRQRHALRLVRVEARAETCAARIAARDPSRQIQVSPELVREMHARTEALQLAWDGVVVNDPPLSDDAIARAFTPILGDRAPGAMLDRLDALEIAPLSPADAEAITRWRYAGQYAFYDPSGERESDSVGYMLDPDNRFHSIRQRGQLVGFCCFGADARVAGGDYGVDALDLGAGMSPALVGRGHGGAFLGAVVEHATRALGAGTLRATIASWNERARRAAQGVGFRPVSSFLSAQDVEFTILLRRPPQ